MIGDHLSDTRVTRLPVGICRNSLGPWALDCGPKTPVIKNCASGNCSPSIAMNGMVPPSPMNIAGLSKNANDALLTESESHSANGGAFQPSLA